MIITHFKKKSTFLFLSIGLMASINLGFCADPAVNFEAWMTIFNTSSPLEKDRLLSEAEVSGWLTWERAKTLWETPTHRPWLLSSLSMQQIQSMNLKQWSPSLRTQLWLRGLMEDFGGEELKTLAKQQFTHAQGEERTAIEALLGSSGQIKSKDKADWSISALSNILQQKDWNQQSKAIALLENHGPSFKPEEFKHLWQNASPAGRFVLATHLCSHPQSSLVSAIQQAFDGDQDRTLCLYMLHQLPPQGHSEWLLSKVVDLKLKGEQLNLAFATLNHWNEVKEDRRYLDLFHGSLYVRTERFVPL